MGKPMPKPKARSRYIRRMHKLEERVRKTLETKLHELEEFLREASTEEVRASLMLLPSEDAHL
jgi:hypothetical protein